MYTIFNSYLSSFLGSILTSLGVTVEEDGDSTNDDKILSCCLNLDAGQPPTTADGKRTVFRTAVLLTDDRFTIPTNYVYLYSQIF